MPESLFNKVAVLRHATLLKRGSGTCNFIKKRLWHRCFPVNVSKFVRALFSQNTSWLLSFVKSDSKPSSWWSFPREVPLEVNVIAREALYWNDSNFWWNAKFYAWSCIISPWSRWCLMNNLEVLGKTLWNFCNRRIVLLTCLQDRRNKLKKQMAEEVMKMRSLKQVVLNSWRKSEKLEKFTFSSVENWKHATLLQANFYRASSEELIRCFVISYNFWEL